uniref:FPL domain-containing protein n=1 Tax=Fagus sylvatica TaxID=28930 RepID=A0A2N9FWI1_FAGSY
MWRSLWRSIDRFSLQHFKYVINELRQIKVVDRHNRELVIDLLQSIVEIVTYGDRQDPMIFECFMENQVLAEFVRVLKIGRNSRIEAPLLQYLSIMIQNMDSEHAIYYCLSNDYINSIIEHQYEFDGGDLAPYYVSFLRAVSSKINRDTLCLLVKVHGDTVVSFPLYNEALKFACHGEKMIQTAVRALSLNIYNVSDDMVFQFITTPPVSTYFSDLVSNISAVASLYIVCRLLQVVGGKSMIDAVTGVILYPYMTLSVGDATEGDTVNGISNANSFLDHLNDMEKKVCSGPKSEGAENIKSNHLFGHLAEHISSNSQFISGPQNDDCIERNGGKQHIYKMSVAEMRMLRWITRNTRNDRIRNEKIRLKMGVAPIDEKMRGGVLAYAFADNNHSLLLASLFLLLILAESKDLDYLLASRIGLSRMQDIVTHDRSTSQVVDGSIFEKFMPQILNALLKILASQPPLSVLIQRHTGWFLRKLLISQGKRLNDLHFHLFNSSYEQSRERLWKELDGCWFDYIPDTFRNEWQSCKTALEESSQLKDPFFALELAVCQQHTDGDTTTVSAWQRMVEAVKDFILHLQLKAVIFKGDLLEKSVLNMPTGPTADSGRSHASDISSASFGSDVSLGSGIPCRIAFSNAGIRDIYLIPVARGTTGKLLLTEKHPFRSQRGVVIAIAPLAGLCSQMGMIRLGQCTVIVPTSEDNDAGLMRSENVRTDVNCCSCYIAMGRFLVFSHSPLCRLSRIWCVGFSAQLLARVDSHGWQSYLGRIICISLLVRANLYSLVGSSYDMPKIDKDHPSWLHLRIREFDPRFNTSKAISNHLKMSNHVADGRWTIGFPNAKACEAARFIHQYSRHQDDEEVRRDVEREVFWEPPPSDWVKVNVDTAWVSGKACYAAVTRNSRGRGSADSAERVSETCKYQRPSRRLVYYAALLQMGC